MDELVREGARRMLRSAIDAEVEGSSSGAAIAVTSRAAVWWFAMAACLAARYSPAPTRLKYDKGA